VRQYAVPWDLVFSLTPHVRAGSRQNIHAFTRAIVDRMPEPPRILDARHIPAADAFTLVANHYQRRGLWILHTAAAITQGIVSVRGPADPPVRWMVTANWPRWRVGPFSMRSPGDLLLPRVAAALQCYPVSFVGANPAFTAGSVKRMLREARASSTPVGLFPEGVAGAAGQLTAPLPGVDRVLTLLNRPILPCAVWEADDRLHLRFGPALPPHQAPQAMSAIARLMP